MVTGNSESAMREILLRICGGGGEGATGVAKVQGGISP